MFACFKNMNNFFIYLRKKSVFQPIGISNNTLIEKQFLKIIKVPVDIFIFFFFVSTCVLAMFYDGCVAHMGFFVRSFSVKLNSTLFNQRAAVNVKNIRISRCYFKINSKFKFMTKIKIWLTNILLNNTVTSISTTHLSVLIII